MKIIINQPFGIGDILFISPLIKQLDVEHIVWPIVDHYYWINNYITIDNLTFIKQSEFNSLHYTDYDEIPLQHAHSIISQANDCMEAKYLLLEADPELWRTLSFNRNPEKESQLKRLLNINPDDKFIFIKSLNVFDVSYVKLDELDKFIFIKSLNVFDVNNIILDV